ACFTATGLGFPGFHARIGCFYMAWYAGRDGCAHMQPAGKRWPGRSDHAGFRLVNHRRADRFVGELPGSRWCRSKLQDIEEDRTLATPRAPFCFAGSATTSNPTPSTIGPGRVRASALR